MVLTFVECPTLTRDMTLVVLIIMVIKSRFQSWIKNLFFKFWIKSYYEL